MGFLSGVLGAVKKDPSVSTYYKNMDKTLQKIKDSMHNPGGLSAAVDAVSTALGEWDGELTSRTKYTIDKFKTLTTVNISNMHDALNDLNRLSDDADLQYVAAHLGNCISKAQELSTAFDHAEGGYKTLDKNLKDKLKNAVFEIKLQVKSFVEAAKNEELKELLRETEIQLNVLKRQVRDRVEKRIGQLTDTLQRTFETRIKTPIENLNEKLGAIHNNLDAWLRKTSAVIDSAIKKATQIHERLVKQTRIIKEGADGFERDAEKRVSGMIDSVRSLLGDARKSGHNLEKASQNASEQMLHLKDMATDVFARAKCIAENIKLLDNKIKNKADDEMNKVFFHSMAIDVNDIQGEIEALVNGINEAIGNLAETIVSDNIKSIKDMLTKLNREDITGLKTTIEKVNEESSALDKMQYPTLNYLKYIVGPSTNGTTIFDKLKNALTIPASSAKRMAVRTTVAAQSPDQEKSPAENVDAAIEKVRTKVKQLQTEFEKKYSTPKSHIQSLRKTLADIKQFSGYLVAKETGIPNDVSLVERNIRNFENQFKKLIDAVETSKVTRHINELGNALGSSMNQIVKYISDTGKHFSALTEELSKLQNELYDEKDKDVIERLSDVLSKGFFGFKEWNGIVSFTTLLAEIKSIIDGPNTANTLARIIEDANTFYSSVIHYEAETVIAHLQAFVAGRSAAALTAIQSRAKEDYYEATRKMFTAMQRDVHMQIDEINNLIALDYNNGVKGLLKRVMDKDNAFSGSNNKLKKLDVKKTDSIQANERLRSLSANLKAYLVNILSYVFYPVGTGLTDDPAKKVKNIQTDVDELLEHLSVSNDSKKYNYDNKFVTFLTSLSSSLTALHPSAFANPRHPELLDAVRAGLQGFVKEMERVYVNGYDGGEGIKMWYKNDKESGYLTTKGRNGAKVFLSFLPMLLEDLTKLNDKCRGNWKNQFICETNGENENLLGKFLKRCGYKVAKSDTSKDGESECKKSRIGINIYDRLATRIFDASIVNHLKACDYNKDNKKEGPEKVNFDYFDLLKCLYHHLDQFNEVGHLSTLGSRRQPCSVYEMLLWLSGLPHHPVHTAMRDETILEIIENINKDEKKTDIEADGFTFSMGETISICLEAYPRKVPYDSLQKAVTHICSQAYDVLCAIAGTGDADTFYASDYCNNSMKFNYPASGEDCLDMFLDILRRMLPTLQFLKQQCELSTNMNGWQQCKYGKDIKTGKWPCNEHSSDESNDETNCQPNSPLMGYLNDCLPGHLPHQLSKIGCKYECNTCPSTLKKGMPCLTPLGFRGFSGNTKRGKELGEVLTKFLGNEYIQGLFCLQPQPPKTLPEHFGFALTLVKGWINITNFRNKGLPNISFQSAFEASVRDLSIDLYSDPYELTKSLTKSYGSQSVVHDSCEHPHLVNFTSSDICTNRRSDVSCASYLNIASNETYSYLVNKHAGLYVSWAVYLPWSFWELLNNLYKDFCNIFCADWGCRGCLRGDKCKRGEHGTVDDKTGDAKCKCSSIVRCKGVPPLLYRYGFAFGNVSELDETKFEKTCSNFCHQLKKLLDSKYFIDLFENCDKFIFTIRAPFIWLNVALWLLSLLYLLHIMVIRLDLLHIKSHLHSPSSHRIAAQSLLAAARVGKLSKVFYLQP
ncbi:hypothetical protein, conserved [Babesia bigemina]|uniref:C3H1-type domain-containing protein n=1 Tax=Babesia bigemina TaxID=5866 RepID=A0A061BJW5_BABBI|nr:hypothetical protein, conserved [Babesia bigemina]CDR71752.1 hypothetical protein, conserved [Babesia bigemina]|eukprot:XP_012770697.1 hypothetical protein, conserved [Babesia bigemina]